MNLPVSYEDIEYSDLQNLLKTQENGFQQYFSSILQTPFTIIPASLTIFTTLLSGDDEISENSRDYSQNSMEMSDDLSETHEKPLKIAENPTESLENIQQTQEIPEKIALFNKARAEILTNFVAPSVKVLTFEAFPEEFKEKPADPQPIFLKNSEVIAKWWAHYLLFLKEIFEKTADFPHKSLTSEESSELQKTLRLLDHEFHWKLCALRACCGFFNETVAISQEKREFPAETVRKYYISKVFQELQGLKLRRNQGSVSQTQKLLTFCEDSLQALQNFLETAGKRAIFSAITGKISKKHAKTLSHSIIFCENGGIFALWNTISDLEREALIESHAVSRDFLANFPQKLVIGSGTNGKIRLCICLSRSENSAKLAVGRVLCVKKCVDSLKTSAWDDYSSRDLERLVFCPAIYDQKLLFSRQKGYTVQEFVAVLDGNRAFRGESPFAGNWRHQKAYLLDVFMISSKLLRNGVALTDLKPANTLYDAENLRVFLIDLAGTVRENSAPALRKVKAFRIREFTKEFSAPEILNFEEDDEELDLCKALSYSLGCFLREIVLKFSKTSQISKQITELFNEMVRVDPRKRLEPEEACEKLRKIAEQSAEGEEDEKTRDFTEFARKYYEKCSEAPEKFGLCAKSKQISHSCSYIPLKCSRSDPNLEDFPVDLQAQNLQENPESPKNNPNIFEDLDSAFREFLLNKEQSVFILLGSSGSGKSLFLQKKFLEALENFSSGDAMPIFLDLCTQEDPLKVHWARICEEIRGKSPSFSLENKQVPNFSTFAQRYPVLLFLDKFDESATKLNFVEKFFKELGNNPDNKAVVCCRSEFIQKDSDFVRFFKPSSEDFPSSAPEKRFIVPLDRTSFDFSAYVSRFYSDFSEKIKEKTSEVRKKLQEPALKDLIKTSCLLRMTLEVLPELLHSQRISKALVYEKFVSASFLKISPGFREFLRQSCGLSDSSAALSAFLKEKAQFLAAKLHEQRATKLFSQENGEFFKVLGHDSHVAALENPVFMAFVRALDLSCEVQGALPCENVGLGFSHAALKSYFLANFFLEEVKNGEISRKCTENQQVSPEKKRYASDFPKKEAEVLKICAFGQRLIASDGHLLEFLAHGAANSKEIAGKLLQIVENSRSARHEEQITASANAISVLNAANFTFTGLDLREIQVPGACLRGGLLNYCDFSRANLSGVDFAGSVLDHSRFFGANLKEIVLGVLPELNLGGEIQCADFSQRTADFAYALRDNSLNVWSFRADLEFQEHPSKKQGFNGGRLLRSLQGHTKTVNFCVFSSDDFLILSGSDDESLRLWQHSSGKLLKQIDLGTEALCGSFSRDNTRIFVGCGDQTVKIYGKAAWQLLKVLGLHISRVTSLVISHDDSLFACGGGNGSLVLWDRGKRRPRISVAPCGVELSALCFALDDCELFAGFADGRLMARQTAGKAAFTWDAHLMRVSKIDELPGGKTLVSGSFDKTVKVWARKSRVLLKSFEAHSDIVTSLGVFREKELLFTVSRDCKLKLWDFSRGSVENVGKMSCGHKKQVNCLRFAEDSRWFASGGEDGVVNLWEFPSCRLIKTLEGRKNAVRSLSFAKKPGKPFETFLFLGYEDGHINEIPLSVDSTEQNLEKPEFPSENQEIPASTMKISDIYAHKSSINGLCVLGTEFLVSCSRDRSIKLWEFVENPLFLQEKAAFLTHTDNVTAVVANPLNTKMFLSVSADNYLILWQLPGTNPYKQLKTHSSINAADFSPDGELIAVGCEDGTVRIFTSVTGNLMKIFEGHRSWALCVRFSPDGKFVASGSQDFSVKVWEIAAQKLSKTLKAHVAGISAIEWSSDGVFLISGAQDASLRVWARENPDFPRKSGESPEIINEIPIEERKELEKSRALSKKIAEKSCGNAQSRDIFAYCRSFRKKFVATASSYKRKEQKSAEVEVWLWDKKTLFKKTAIHSKKSSEISVLAFSFCESQLACGFCDGDIVLWDFSKEIEKLFPRKHQEIVTNLQFSPDNSLLLSGCHGKIAVLWDLKTRRSLRAFEKFENTLDFSRNGEKIIVENQVFDTKTGKMLEILPRNAVSGEFFAKSPKTFKCIRVLSGNETRLSCKGAVFLDCEGIDNETQRVFVQKRCLKLERSAGVQKNKGNSLGAGEKSYEKNQPITKTQNFCCRFF